MTPVRARRCTHHCVPWDLGDFGVCLGEEEEEEEECEHPVEDGHEHDPAERGHAEVVCTGDQSTHQQTQDLWRTHHVCVKVCVKVCV